MDTASAKPRRPWLAALLSLCGGPLGQVYAGRLRRGLCLWVVGACVLPVLIFSAILLPLGKLGLIVMVLCALGFPLFLAIDAFLLARRNPVSPRKGYQRWWVYVGLFFGFVLGQNAVAHVMKSFLAEAFVIPSRSMCPTIQAGDRILVDKLWYRWNPVRRNEIVVFRSQGPGSPPFAMRVVGLSGDEIEITNERVFINGTEWDDENAVFDRAIPPYSELAYYKPSKVPVNCFFVLGDNRRLSKDSRILGPIPIADLCGKARAVYWARERVFPNPDDTTRYYSGSIRWDRIGLRLD